MKANIRRVLSCFSIMFVGSMLGFVLGFGFVYLMNEGAFVSWAPFPAPIKFEKILQASSTTIWAQASDGSIYEGDILCQEGDCQPWRIVEQARVDLPVTKWPIKRRSDCEFDEFSLLKTLVGEPIECVEAYFGGYDSGTTVYYALLDDGSIFIWKNSISSITALIIPFFSTIGIGMAAGMVGFVYGLERRKESTAIRISAG